MIKRGRIKKKIIESDFKYTSTALIDFAHIYGEVVDIFRKISRNDLDNVINIKYENINSRLAIREYLMKTPKNVLTENKPILDINTSLETDFEDDVFSPLAFNTDLSHIIDIKKVSNIFTKTHNREDNSKNIAIAFSFKRIKLNIELNIIGDFKQKLLNVYHYWKSIKYPGRMYRKNIVVSFPIPKEVYMEYCKLHELDKHNKYEVYKHIRRHSFYPIDFKKNLSTGNEDIFFMYETFMDYTPGMTNLSDGQMKGTIKEDFRLTRAFDIVVTVPSMCFIRLNRERFFMYNDEVDHDPEAIKLDVSEWIPYDWMEYSKDGYEQIINSSYDFNKVEEDIDCKKLLYGDFKDFYDYLKDNDIDVSEYILIRYFKNGKDNDDNTYMIDKEGLIIKEFNADYKSMYTVAIYIKLEYYNTWLKEYGINKRGEQYE